MAATTPRRPGTTGPPATKLPCVQPVSVLMAGAGAPDDGPATNPEPAADRLATRVHSPPGWSGSNVTLSPGAPMPDGMKPAETATRSQRPSTGKRNGDPL